MSSIAGNDGTVQIHWAFGRGTQAFFTGFERLTVEEFKLLDQALRHPEFLADMKEWAKKQEFVDSLRG